MGAQPVGGSPLDPAEDRLGGTLPPFTGEWPDQIEGCCRQLFPLRLFRWGIPFREISTLTGKECFHLLH